MFSGDPYNVLVKNGFRDTGNFPRASHSSIPQIRHLPTFDTLANTWTQKQDKIESTLDYIFIKSNNYEIEVEEFQTRDYKTSQGSSFSDHVALFTKFGFKCNSV